MNRGCIIPGVFPMVEAQATWDRLVLLGWCTPRVSKLGRNPFRVEKNPPLISQGSSFLATLGFVAESLWDSLRQSCSRKTFSARFRILYSWFRILHRAINVFREQDCLKESQ